MLKMHHYTEIPGAMTVREGDQLAHLTQGKLVLEIGSLYGRSTVAMARKARQLHSVDWHRGDKHAGQRDSLHTFINNLNIHNVRHKVVIHVCKAEEMEEILAPGCFDFAFVDGLHTYEATRKFIQIAKKCVKPGGLIAVHDYYDIAHIDFWSKKGVDAEFEKLEMVVDSLAVARVATASEVVSS
jgi:predicted O-methyltransferase YrrM